MDESVCKRAGSHADGSRYPTALLGDRTCAPRSVTPEGETSRTVGHSQAQRNTVTPHTRTPSPHLSRAMAVERPERVGRVGLEVDLKASVGGRVGHPLRRRLGASAHERSSSCARVPRRSSCATAALSCLDSRAGSSPCLV